MRLSALQNEDSAARRMLHGNHEHNSRPNNHRVKIKKDRTKNKTRTTKKKKEQQRRRMVKITRAGVGEREAQQQGYRHWRR